MGKSKGLTFFLSMVPGVGHYYLGLMQRGLQFSLMFFGLIFILAATNIGLLGLFLPVIWFYALFDALQMVNMIDRDGRSEDRPVISWRRLPVKASIIGWVLIFLGLYSFLLVNPFFGVRSFLNHYELNSMLAAAVLIGFGLYLLLHPQAGQGTAAAQDCKGDEKP